MLHRHRSERGLGFLGAFTMALKASEEACTVGGFMVLLDVRGGQYLKDFTLVYQRSTERVDLKCIYATLRRPFQRFVRRAKSFRFTLDRRSSSPATVG